MKKKKDIGNRLISIGLEPVLSHTEKLCLVLHYIQFSTDFNLIIVHFYLRKAVYDTMREINIKEYSFIRKNKLFKRITFLINWKRRKVSCACFVIKMHLKGKKEGRSEKRNPYMDLDVFLLCHT